METFTYRDLFNPRFIQRYNELTLLMKKSQRKINKLTGKFSGLAFFLFFAIPLFLLVTLNPKMMGMLAFLLLLAFFSCIIGAINSDGEVGQGFWGRKAIKFHPEYAKYEEERKVLGEEFAQSFFYEDKNRAHLFVNMIDTIIEQQKEQKNYDEMKFLLDSLNNFKIQYVEQDSEGLIKSFLSLHELTRKNIRPVMAINEFDEQYKLFAQKNPEIIAQMQQNIRQEMMQHTENEKVKSDTHAALEKVMQVGESVSLKEKL